MTEPLADAIDELFTLVGAARYLGTTRRYVYRHAEAGDLATIPITGGSRVLSRGELDRHAAAGPFVALDKPSPQRRYRHTGTTPHDPSTSTTRETRVPVHPPAHSPVHPLCEAAVLHAERLLAQHGPEAALDYLKGWLRRHGDSIPAHARGGAE